VAMILAIFADKEIKHGPLEALITSNEEDGLLGVQAFDVNKIKAKYLINLDSEDDKEICIGCPGNCDIETEISFTRDKKRPKSKNLCIHFFGGKGGHSGQTIAEKKVNAIKEVINTIGLISDNCDIRLVEFINSGTAKNNIPGEASAIINILEKDKHLVENLVKEEFNSIKASFDEELNINMVIEQAKSDLRPISKSDTNKIIAFLMMMPNGINTFN
jgi:dipeptidase D